MSSLFLFISSKSIKLLTSYPQIPLLYSFSNSHFVILSRVVMKQILSSSGTSKDNANVFTPGNENADLLKVSILHEGCWRVSGGICSDARFANRFAIMLSGLRMFTICSVTPFVLLLPFSALRIRILYWWGSVARECCGVSAVELCHSSYIGWLSWELTSTSQCSLPTKNSSRAWCQVFRNRVNVLEASYDIPTSRHVSFTCS